MRGHISSVHEGIKPFHCSICSKDFFTSFKLKKHISRFHENEKSYQCQSCNESFSEEFLLARHVLSNHSLFTKENIQAINNKLSNMSEKDFSENDKLEEQIQRGHENEGVK